MTFVSYTTIKSEQVKMEIKPPNCKSTKTKKT